MGDKKTDLNFALTRLEGGTRIYVPHAEASRIADARAEFERLEEEKERHEQEKERSKEQVNKHMQDESSTVHWLLAEEPSLFPLYSLANVQSAKSLNERMGSRDEKGRKRTQEMLDYLTSLTPYRELASVPPIWEAALGKLRSTHPNFAAVVDFLADEFALAEALEEPAQLPPILFDGPPGVGKTTFAKAIADLLGTGFLKVNMESAQTASALTGTDEHWANAKTGQLFQQLVGGQYANPVVLIDELDKARKDSSYDAASGLYTLLEPSSASHWHDLALPLIKIDASRVNWIITSNNARRIPDPLLSRMRIFAIPGLTTDQARETARRIFSDQVQALKKIEFSSELPYVITTALTFFSPREMHRLCRELIAKAVRAGRREVRHVDINVLPLLKAGKINSGILEFSIEVDFNDYGLTTLH